MPKTVAGVASKGHGLSRDIRVRAWRTRQATLTRVDRVICVVLAAPAIWLGVGFWNQDAADPMNMQGLLVDRALQVSAMIAAAGLALIVVARPRYALGGVLACSAFGVLLSATLLLAGFMGPAPRAPVMALAGVALLCSGYAIYRYGSRLHIPLGSRPWVAVAGFTAASLIPGLQLWSSTSYLPSRVEASLTQHLAVTPAVAPAEGLRSTVTNEITNPTAKRVVVIISDLKVCSWSEPEDVIWDTDRLRDRSNCVSSRPVMARTWIPAGGTLEYDIAVTSPATEPLLQVVARIAFASGDRVRESLDTGRRLEVLGACSDVQLVKLQPESRYKGLAQEATYLVFADFNRDRGVNYFFSIGEPHSCPQPATSPLSRYLGATEATRVMTTWLSAPVEGSAEPEEPAGVATP